MTGASPWGGVGRCLPISRLGLRHPQPPAGNMNPHCKVGFDYLIKRCPLMLAQQRGCHGDQRAGPKGGRVGANYCGCCEERAHHPLRRCQRGPRRRTEPQKLVSGKQLARREWSRVFVPDAHFLAGLGHLAALPATPRAGQLSPGTLLGYSPKLKSPGGPDWRGLQARAAGPHSGEVG